MKIITKHSEIVQQVNHWRAHIERQKKDALRGLADTQENLRLVFGNTPVAIAELDPSAPDIVAKYEAVFGHFSAGRCGECETKADTLLQIGEEPDYESSTAYLCIDCTRKGMALIEKELKDAACRGDGSASHGPDHGTGS